MGEVLMPQMGESIVEGTITKWLKELGDKVERDEALFEISTDKVDSEVPAPESGVLEAVFFPEGDTVAINTVVALIGDGSRVGRREAPSGDAQAAAEAEPAASSPAAPPAAEAAPTPAPSAARGRIRSSPLVRRIAKEHGIDLAALDAGSGRDGRITKKDILAYIERRESAPRVPAAAVAPFQPTPEARFGRYSVQPLSPMRRSIAEHMVRSMRVSPHVSTVHQVDCTAVARQRAAAKDKFLAQNGTKLTFLPFFLRAASSALKAYPTVNASLDGKDLILHREINIGIAVALDWGLIVPGDSQRRREERPRLAARGQRSGRAGRARSSSSRTRPPRGTFSISNYGSYNSLLATPAINQPQTAILGLGAVTKTPVVIDDAIAIRSIAYLTLTFDHRAIDGGGRGSVSGTRARRNRGLERVDFVDRLRYSISGIRSQGGTHNA